MSQSLHLGGIDCPCDVCSVSLPDYPAFQILESGPNASLCRAVASRWQILHHAYMDHDDSDSIHGLRGLLSALVYKPFAFLRMDCRCSNGNCCGFVLMALRRCGQ